MISHRHLLVTILSVLISYECYCEDFYMLLCECQEKTLSCPNNSTIKFTFASYGYNGSNAEARRLCDKWIKVKNLLPWLDNDDTECHEPRSTEILRNKCKGLSKCEVIASNDVFGDPCLGITKYLEIFFRCEQDEHGVGDDHGSIENNDENEKGNMREDPRNNEDDEEEEGLAPVSVSTSAGISVAVIVIIVIGLIYFLRKKRNTKNQQNIGIFFKSNNVSGSLNLEYEIVGSTRNNPATHTANQLPYYESSIHVNSRNFEYDYAVDTGLVGSSEPQETYLNVK